MVLPHGIESHLHTYASKAITREYIMSVPRPSELTYALSTTFLNPLLQLGEHPNQENSVERKFFPDLQEPIIRIISQSVPVDTLCTPMFDSCLCSTI